jgi:uncharacterized protein YndB with AHSA1/START domain
MTVDLDLKFEVEVDAPISLVWETWTTPKGVKSFFAPDCRMDLKPGGQYEMLFNLDDKEGYRGGEGCVLLALEEPKMLSFTWNAPPEFPEIRQQKTHVTVYLESLTEQRTRVTLIHDGWGCSEDWQLVQKYFERAWGFVVLPRLKQRFLQGPIHWDELN